MLARQGIISEQDCADILSGLASIADDESPDRPAHRKLEALKSYGLSLGHKHLPEMQKISGLAHTPMFVPVVCLSLIHI